MSMNVRMQCAHNWLAGQCRVPGHILGLEYIWFKNSVEISSESGKENGIPSADTAHYNKNVHSIHSSVRITESECFVFLIHFSFALFFNRLRLCVQCNSCNSHRSRCQCFWLHSCNFRIIDELSDGRHINPTDWTCQMWMIQWLMYQVFFIHNIFMGLSHIIYPRSYL